MSKSLISYFRKLDQTACKSFMPVLCISKQTLLHKRMCFDPILIVNRQSAISRAF